jgi:hypothetical protein
MTSAANTSSTLTVTTSAPLHLAVASNNPI